MIEFIKDWWWILLIIMLSLFTGVIGVIYTVNIHNVLGYIGIILSVIQLLLCGALIMMLIEINIDI